MSDTNTIDTVKTLGNWQQHIIHHTGQSSSARTLFLTEQQVLATLELAKQIASFHETFKKTVAQ